MYRREPRTATVAPVAGPTTLPPPLPPLPRPHTTHLPPYARRAPQTKYGAVPTIDENLELGTVGIGALAGSRVSDPSNTDPNPIDAFHSLSESSLNIYELVAEDHVPVKLPLAQPISLANMHVIAFAGMRGAVSFSLAYIFPDTHGNR